MGQDERAQKEKVVVELNNVGNSEYEVDLFNVFSYMGQKKKLVSYLLIISLLVGMLAGCMYSLYEHMSGKGSYVRAMISFQFSGIEQGLDPNGASFDVTTIKSPYVIEQALKNLSISESEIENIRENISIVGVIPKDAVEQITTYEKMAEKDAKNYEKVLEVSYFPSQYVVYLYDDGSYNSKQLTEILNEVIASYKQYFLDTYANSEVLTVTSNLLSGSDYDYGESIDLVKTQIQIMLSYVTEKMDEAPDFRSSKTGLSFDDIVTSLNFVKTVDIARLSSYVQSKSLTKDKSKQIDYYEYMIRETSNQISELQTQEESVQKIISSYEKDPVVIVSGADSTIEYGTKGEYYDQLVENKIKLDQQISEANTSLNEYYLQLNKLNEMTVSALSEDFEYADKLLDGLNSTISSWVKLVEETTEEYYKTARFSNAVSVAVPAQYYADGGIVHIAKNIAIPCAVLLALAALWWFYSGLKMEIVASRRKEIRKETEMEAV